eukprot:574511-Hanusia_phi.AAC.1
MKVPLPLNANLTIGTTGSKNARWHDGANVGWIGRGGEGRGGRGEGKEEEDRERRARGGEERIGRGEVGRRGKARGREKRPAGGIAVLSECCSGILLPHEGARGVTGIEI